MSPINTRTTTVAPKLQSVIMCTVRGAAPTCIDKFMATLILLDIFRAR
jgi:response regulator of citrate/malate metabolism